MVNITEKLSTILKNNTGAPFLFVGSGFSRRYIGLEQWDELLRKFCDELRDFGYYASRSNNEMPTAAGLIADDFNEVWWKSDSYRESRSKYRNNILTRSSALKLEISRYLTEKSYDSGADGGLSAEIASLPRLNVDGIITTNWDLFLEEIFPDYKVYVGQEELLFSNPQSIAEIYKIHGCASQPDSLVLTQHDYSVFDSKNAYLAAKLITIFVEHPVVFIGYSLGDPNIQKIISSIISCLRQNQLDQFGQNLIFLQRCKDGEEPALNSTIMTIRDTNLNITVVKTDNFLQVYDAIEDSKRKIPARILRYCKEQMYDLVAEAKPSSRLAVVDIDQIENKDDIEFVVGVGVAAVQDRISKKGYSSISLDEVFLDVLNDDTTYDADNLLTEFYPTLFKRPNKYIPAFKYLRLSGISNIESLRASKHESIEKMIRKSKAAPLSSYQGHYDSHYRGKTTAEIIQKAPVIKASIMIMFQNEDQIDVEVVRNFLRDNSDELKPHNPSSSYFRKLVCLYDRLKYGFPINNS